MGKSLNDLGLQTEQLPTAGQELADLPEFGSFRLPPQPGAFRFKLPADLSSVWEVFDTPALKPPQRIRAVFDRDHPLVIVQSPQNKYQGDPFETRVSNAERPRGKDKSVIASDMDYLLRALGVKAKPQTNAAYVQVMQAQKTKEFSADLRYSWKCSQDRNIRVRDNQGAVQEVEGTKGCNTAYYQEDVPHNADGTMPYEITCSCGALLRAFANLDNIRA
jgi:hypothetical protein